MKTRTYALLAISCGALALVMLSVHLAFAQGAPDPVSQPAETLSLIEKLWQAHTYIPLAILGSFWVARALDAHVKSPNVAHWIGIFVGAVTLFVPGAVQGQTPNTLALAMAIGPIIALLLPGLAPRPASSQAGFVRPFLLLPIAGICAGILACSSCGAPTPVPVTDLIDCIKAESLSDWPTIEAKLKPDVEAENWSQLIIDAEALGPQVGLDVASCVAVELVQQYLSTKHTQTSVTWGAHDAVEQLRAKLSAPGKSVTFSTKLGKL